MLNVFNKNRFGSYGLEIKEEEDGAHHEGMEGCPASDIRPHPWTDLGFVVLLCSVLTHLWWAIVYGWKYYPASHIRLYPYHNTSRKQTVVTTPGGDPPTDIRPLPPTVPVIKSPPFRSVDMTDNRRY